MDELELLKKDWNKTENDYPKLSFNDIYQMIHKKSSSIVKWIFIISIIELSIGLILIVINPRIENAIEYPRWIEFSTYLTIPVILYFIYKFYINYKNITTTDTVKALIKSILKTRKTVKYYVLFNLIFGGITSAIMAYIGYIQLSGGFNKFNETAHFKEYAILILLIIIITAIIIACIYGIYYLLYGILLKRLNKNYKELKKLEI